jgi:hypothetical protein
MKLESQLPQAQETAAGPYSKLEKSSPQPHALFI